MNGVSVRSGATVTVRRCNIYHTVDGVNAGDALGSVVTLEGNYIHDLAFYNNSTDQAASTPAYWTHNDGLQLLGDAGHVVIGNNFSSYLAPVAGMQGVSTTEAGYDDGIRGVPSAQNAWSAGVTISPNAGGVVATIEYNWFDGGTASFQSNALPSGQPTWSGGSIGYNRFGYDQWDYNSGATIDKYQIRYITGYSYNNLLTNYFDPDSPTVPANLKGVMFDFGFDKGIRVS